MTDKWRYECLGCGGTDIKKIFKAKGPRISKGVFRCEDCNERYNRVYDVTYDTEVRI